MKGLVLSGGLSSRMGQDKGALVYSNGVDSYGNDQRSRCHSLLSSFCDEVLISCRENQLKHLNPNLPYIYDTQLGAGPGVGILSAFQKERDHAWFILACDMPHVDSNAVATLARNRNPQKAATLFIHPRSHQIEPLFAIWEPEALVELEREFKTGRFSPRKTLEKLDCQILLPHDEKCLINVNTMEDYKRLAVGVEKS